MNLSDPLELADALEKASRPGNVEAYESGLYGYLADSRTLMANAAITIRHYYRPDVDLPAPCMMCGHFHPSKVDCSRVVPLSNEHCERTGSNFTVTFDNVANKVEVVREVSERGGFEAEGALSTNLANVSDVSRSLTSPPGEWLVILALSAALISVLCVVLARAAL